MGDSDKSEGVADDAKVAERRKEFTRRALLRAGWTAPLITTVNIPSALAQSPAPTPGHTDHTDHVDLPHTDHTDVPHTDHADGPHTDHADTPHTDHADSPHQDHQDHVDVHADAHSDSHVDIHTDVHEDVAPHVDVPHEDA